MAHLIENASQSNWMSSLDGDCSLTQLTLPGSHDTCAYTVDDTLARTQGATLAEQLAHGVRVLDIRCRHEGDVFHINHARVPLGLMFDDVIQTCATFLAQHPGECIVMSIKDECGTHACSRTFSQTFEDYVARYPAVRWYLDNTIPRLSEVRGAIVLLRRFESPHALGIDLSAWPDNSTFELDRPDACFAIQDEFRVPVRRSIGYKWQVIDALLQHTPQVCAQRWVVNFCSGTGMSAHPYWVACGNSELPGINGMMVERLAAHTGPAGTMMLDFCEHDDWALVRALLARNF